jgi:hypothetical protein
MRLEEKGTYDTLITGFESIFVDNRNLNFLIPISEIPPSGGTTSLRREACHI